MTNAAPHSRTPVSCVTGWLMVVLVLFGMAGTVQAQELQQRFSAANPASTKTLDHSAWQALLSAYVATAKDGLNRVDYARFKKEGAQKLKAYLAQLQKVDVAALNKNEQFAYWVNLYNAVTVDIILDHYPVPSIREIRLSGVFSVGPWKKKIVTVKGVRLSLDDIEHQILRPLWRDPRVHYAVNCAAVGCPNLQTKAFTSARLEKMLDKGARDYINSPRGVKLRDGKVVASKIFSWFAADFGGNEKSVLAHISRYAKPTLASQISDATRISRYEYSWGLNGK